MADATTAVAVDAATMRIPVVILSASVAALVTMALSWLAVVLDASRAVVIATMVMAIVGGCGVLTAVVVHFIRKTSRDTEARIRDIVDGRMDQQEADILTAIGGITKLHELGLKNAKTTRDLARALTECKQQIVSEVEKNRVAFYTLTAEATGTTGRRAGGLRSVDN